MKRSKLVFDRFCYFCSTLWQHRRVFLRYSSPCPGFHPLGAAPAQTNLEPSIEQVIIGRRHPTGTLHHLLPGDRHGPIFPRILVGHARPPKLPAANPGTALRFDPASGVVSSQCLPMSHADSRDCPAPRRSSSLNASFPAESTLLSWRDPDALPTHPLVSAAAVACPHCGRHIHHPCGTAPDGKRPARHRGWPALAGILRWVRREPPLERGRRCARCPRSAPTFLSQYRRGTARDTLPLPLEDRRCPGTDLRRSHRRQQCPSHQRAVLLVPRVQ